jgi:hypothetical protein
MHTWDGPWPDSVRQRLDFIAQQEEIASKKGRDDIARIAMWVYDCIVSEHDLTFNPRQAVQNQEWP